MATDIEVRRLINFETATDGTAVRLLVDDVAGRTVGIIFTIETLSALLMTLPTMAASAIKRAHNDPTMRITYPATDFQIELSPGNVRIFDHRNAGRIHRFFRSDGGILARTWRGAPERYRSARQDALTARASRRA